MKALVFDWETTGLVKHPKSKISVQPRAIEFGGCLVDSQGRILDELALIIDPQQKLEAIITKITGLTDEDVAGKPKFAEVFPQIREIFSKADILIAHNLPFDKSITQLELQRLGNPEFPWPKYEVCTAQENQPIWGRRPKLLELYEYALGKKLDQTHRALDDCRALAEIVIQGKYIDRIITAAEGEK